jgi:outer membrane receptor protein involved in Fe transport
VAPPDLERLSNKGLFGPVILDAPEDLPLFEAGEVTQVGAALNQVVSERLTAHLRYRHSASENTGAAFAGNPLPYIPKHQTTLGATWAGPQRLYLSTQAVYRTLRYKDEDPSRPLDPGWAASVKLYWETADKKMSTSIIAERSADPAIATVYRLGLGYRL